MRILKYNLNLAFNTLKYIMAYGVSNLQTIPRGASKKAKVASQSCESSTTTVVPECSPAVDVFPSNEFSINQIEVCDEYVLYSSEVEVPAVSAPEPEFEVEVESSDIVPHRLTTPKLRRRTSGLRDSPHKISTINRRSRLWVKQMRRRRRMSLFDGVQRYRLRYPLSKRWNTVTAPRSARVDVKILKLLQNKRKQLKRDGLYQFVLWREALKAERNRLLGPRNIHG